MAIFIKVKVVGRDVVAAAVTISWMEARGICSGHGAIEIKVEHFRVAAGAGLDVDQKVRVHSGGWW